MIFESNAFWVFVIVIMCIVAIYLVFDVIDRYLTRREDKLYDDIYNEFTD